MAPAFSTFSFPQTKRSLFDYWLSRQPTYAFYHPRNAERHREEIRQIDKYIRTIQPNPPSRERDYNIAAAMQCREWSSWRLFRFHALPEDIILKIFKIGTFGDSDSQMSPMNTYRVSRVCRQWRQLAHGASSLWSCIAFGDNADLVHHFVQRSRAYPLTIDINIIDTEFDYGHNRFWPQENHLAECMAILLPQAHRWLSFRCVTDNRDPIAGVIRYLNHARFPMLQSFELYQSWQDGVVGRPLMPLFASTPCSLTTLNLNGVPVNWKHLSDLQLQLTEFSLNLIPLHEQPTPYEYCATLYACRNTLRKLALVNSGPRWAGNFPTDIPVIYFPNLQHFEFRGNNKNHYGLAYLSSLLPVMQFGPALHTLTLTHFTKETYFDHFVPDLSRFSRVKYLRIGYMSINDFELARWLCVFSNVETLYLHGLELQEAVVRVLNTDPKKYNIRGVLCPALKTLSPFWPEIALTVLIKGRARMGFPLTTLEWNVNLRKIVERIGYLQGASDWVKVKFEGELRDPNDRWVGPNVEKGSMDVDMLVDVSKFKDDKRSGGMTAAQKHYKQVAGWRIVI